MNHARVIYGVRLSIYLYLRHYLMPNKSMSSTRL